MSSQIETSGITFTRVVPFDFLWLISTHERDASIAKMKTTNISTNPLI